MIFLAGAPTIVAGFTGTDIQIVDSDSFGFITSLPDAFQGRIGAGGCQPIKVWA